MWAVTATTTAITIVVSALSLTASMVYLLAQREGEGTIALLLASIGWVGVAAGLAIIYSNHAHGRFGWIGLILSFVYFIAMLTPPHSHSNLLHIYGPLSVVTLVLAAWTRGLAFTKEKV